ncbi:MAG: peptidylprolyl isomerase [Armatimonadota bacterium]
MKKHISPVFWTTTGLLVGLLVGTLITAAFSYRPQYDYNQVVATAGETPVTRGELAEHLLFKHGTKMLDDDIRRSAFIKEAARAAGITVTDADVDKRIADYKQLIEQYAELPELMGSKLQMDALPAWLLQDQFRVELLAEKLMHVDFTPKEMAEKVDEIYTQRMDSFRKPALADLTLIVCTDENEAWKLHKRLKSGEDAETLSGKYSTFEAIRKIKGRLGWVPRSQMNVALAKAVFDTRRGAGLRPKEFTDVIEYEWPIDFQMVNGKAQVTRTEVNYVILYVNGTAPMKMTPKKDVLPVLEMLVRTTETSNRLKQRDWFTKAEKTIQWKRVRVLADPLAKPEVIQDAGTPSVDPGALINR